MESEQFKTRQGRWSAGSQISARCPPQFAAERAALLLGCYRRGDANYPETYSAAIAAVLTCFRQDVGTREPEFRVSLDGYLV